MGKSATRRTAGDEAGQPRGATIKVRATQVGYYGEARRRIGDVFTLVPRRGTFTELELDKDGEPKTTKGTLQPTRVTREAEQTLSAEAQFSATWMERVDEATPERSTGPNQDLRLKHDEEMRARHQPGLATGADAPTGAADPLGSD